MKIALVAPLAPDLGCREATPHDSIGILARGLQQAGHQVSWFGAGATSLVRPPAETLYLSAQVRRAPQTVEVWECLHLARCFELAGEFDLVHNHSGALALAFAQFVDTPVLTSLATTPDLDSLPAYRAYQKRGLYVSSGDGTRSAELDYVGSVPPGIEVDRYAFSATGGKSLMVIGPVREDAGVKEALELAEASGRPLLLVGPIEDRAYYQEWVAPRLGQGRIRHVECGSVRSRSELLGEAYALLNLGSDDPRAALGALEAMACGTPVLALRLGVLPELVAEGETGILVETSQEAGERLEELARLDRRRCRDHVSERFGAERMVAATLLVYEQVLAGQKPRARRALPPWGRWEVLLDEASYKVKRIRVEPGKRLSYQRHKQRREHWVIVEGSGVVTLDGEDLEVSAGQAVDVGEGVAHRIANPGDTPLVFIEIQRGDYFGEDDIERLEDDYGRAGTV